MQLCRGRGKNGVKHSLGRSSDDNLHNCTTAAEFNYSVVIGHYKKVFDVYDALYEHL